MPQMAKSRPKRWEEAGAKVGEGLSELADLRDEYEAWFENLPENLWESPVGSKLQEIVDLDFDGMISDLDDALNVELPLGFGRD